MQYQYFFIFLSSSTFRLWCELIIWWIHWCTNLCLYLVYYTILTTLLIQLKFKEIIRWSGECSYLYLFKFKCQNNICINMTTTIISLEDNNENGVYCCFLNNNWKLFIVNLGNLASKSIFNYIYYRCQPISSDVFHKNILNHKPKHVHLLYRITKYVFLQFDELGNVCGTIKKE